MPHRLSFVYVLTDPFAEANAENSGAGSKEYVHIRVQQRNGRKSLTTVQGLKKEFSYNKILKDLKKEFCCNGTVVQDPELGQVKIVIVAPISFFFFSLLSLAEPIVYSNNNLLIESRSSNSKVIKERMSQPSLFRYFYFV